MTQLGIAIGVNINYSHVPRAVKRLQKQGLIFEKTVHIILHPSGRRRRAYFLTEEGVTVARELSSALAQYLVRFKNQEGKVSKMSLADLNKLVQTKEDLFSLYLFLNSDNVFDFIAWESKEKNKKGKEINKLGLEEVKKILGPGFDATEIDAILYHTDGNPRLIETISKIDRSELSEFYSLPAEELALTLCLIARAKLEGEN